MKNIIKKIQTYDTIIIHRHKNPDLDALGSQLGLKELILNNFPNKVVYVVGDENHFSFIGKMDEIKDEVYKDALCIIVDVAVSPLISDDRYNLAKEILVIDHHQNPSDLKATSFIDPSYIACAELIADLAILENLKFTQSAATALYAGIVTDSGRFQYSGNNPRPLFIASKLLENGADAIYVYDNLYQESLVNRQTKNYFATKFQLTRKNVAYLINDSDVYEKFDLTPFNISRGMIGVMAGIKEVPIWCNFTYDNVNNVVLCEFRSKKIPIVQIAKKYGGGGHMLACGATIESFEKVDAILEDFNKLIEEGEKNEL